MRPSLSRLFSAGVTVLLLSGALPSFTAQAATKEKADSPSTSTAQGNKKSAKSSKSSKAPKFIASSEETSAERDRRLLRECKGRVNAGACAGYTR